MGALMEESIVQSRVREMETVASSAALNNFDLVGNCRLVMARSWWVKLPNDLFRGFSTVSVPVRVGRLGLALAAGGVVDRL